MKQHFIDLMHQLGRNTTEACGLFVDRDVRLAWESYQAGQCRNRAMQVLCDGMSTEDMEQAPFTYKALLEIVQRRDVRVPLSALVLPKKGTDENDLVVTGYNLALYHVQCAIDDLMGKQK